MLIFTVTFYKLYVYPIYFSKNFRLKKILKWHPNIILAEKSYILFIYQIYG